MGIYTVFVDFYIILAEIWHKIVVFFANGEFVIRIFKLAFDIYVLSIE